MIVILAATQPVGRPFPYSPAIFDPRSTSLKLSWEVSWYLVTLVMSTCVVIRHLHQYRLFPFAIKPERLPSEDADKIGKQGP